MIAELPIYPNIADVVNALMIALGSYEHEHGGQPTKIAVSYDAFKAINSARLVDICNIDMPTFFNIPIAITREKGFHISLCGPEIIRLGIGEAKFTYQVLWKAKEE